MPETPSTRLIRPQGGAGASTLVAPIAPNRPGVTQAILSEDEFAWPDHATLPDLDPDLDLDLDASLDRGFDTRSEVDVEDPFSGLAITLDAGHGQGLHARPPTDDGPGHVTVTGRSDTSTTVLPPTETGGRPAIRFDELDLDGDRSGPGEPTPTGRLTLSRPLTVDAPQHAGPRQPARRHHRLGWPSAERVRLASLAVAVLALGAVAVLSLQRDGDGPAVALEASSDGPTRLLGAGVPRGFVDRSADAGRSVNEVPGIPQAVTGEVGFAVGRLRTAAGPALAPGDDDTEADDPGELQIGPRSTWVDSGNGVLVPDLLLRIRFCESSNDYQAANPSSTARGAYQFLSKSWAYYGHAARYGVDAAHLATPAQQDDAALRTLESQGTAPWSASRHCWSDPGIDPGYRTARPSSAPPPAQAPTTATTAAGDTTTTDEGASSTASSDTTDTTAEPTSTTGSATSTTASTTTSEAPTTSSSATTSSSSGSSTTDTTAATTTSSS